MVWKLTVASSAVSMICASAIGAVIRRSGSPGKQTVPSGSAQTSPENRNPARIIEKIAADSSKGRVPAKVGDILFA